jgi:hypothetical protein
MRMSIPVAQAAVVPAATTGATMGNKSLITPCATNAIAPVWQHESSFIISTPEMASITVRVYEPSLSGGASATLVAENTIPVTSLRLGYRAVPLRTVAGWQLIDHASVLCHFSLMDGVVSSTSAAHGGYGNRSALLTSMAMSVDFGGD